MKVSLKPTQFRLASLILTCWLALAGSIGGRSSAHGSLHRVADQNQESNTSQKKHQYVVESAWNGCSIIPYEGWEGCMSQIGTALRRDDGARVYFVEENCTSPRAASDKRLLRLEMGDRKEKGWRIKRKIPFGDALVIELAKPVQVFQEEPATSRWICLWTERSSLKLIYGADREHLVDYFQARQSGPVKR